VTELEWLQNGTIRVLCQSVWEKGKMATITIKDIPDDLYAALKQSATANHRSINREVIFCIEQAVRSRRPSVEEIIAEARRIQAEIGPLPINEEILDEAKELGRA
jgi:plasmid stability protein